MKGVEQAENPVSIIQSTALFVTRRVTSRGLDGSREGSCGQALSWDYACYIGHIAQMLDAQYSSLILNIDAVTVYKHRPRTCLFYIRLQICRGSLPLVLK